MKFKARFVSQFYVDSLEFAAADNFSGYVSR